MTTLNATETKLYRQLRSSGTPAKYALREVRVRKAWDELDYGPNSDRTYVRLRIVADETASLADLEGDCFNPKLNDDISPAKLEKEREAFIDRVNRDGVWGLIGEYRVSAEEPWVSVDSCFGFVGDDWKDSGHDIDIMQATMKARQDAIDNVCKHCGRPRA